MLDRRRARYDFSLQRAQDRRGQPRAQAPRRRHADVAASFQEAVVDVLVTKARRAAQEVGAKGLCLGGGVAANSALRDRFAQACAEDGIRAFVPSRPCARTTPP
jgi:N6-L-threonylcarbamoyladenine synthase